MTPVLIAKLIIVLLALLGSWLDAVKRRLPNWLCLVTLIAGLAITGIIAGWPQIGGHLAHAVIALVIGMVLFALRFIGGGDAKFYAGLASWFPLSSAAGLLLSVALAGLVLFFAWFVWRRLTGKKIRRPTADSNEDKLPYGIAIATGAVIQYFLMAG